jgi:hypothetical protein
VLFIEGKVIESADIVLIETVVRSITLLGQEALETEKVIENEAAKQRQ